MRVPTVRFGEIDIPDEHIIHFPAGIFGFPHLRRCCLLPQGPAAGVRWLQSLDDPTLVFLTVEPHLLLPDYELEIADADALALALTHPRHAAVLTLVTISEDGTAATTNLLAPIIINTQTRRARQVILENDRYTTKHLVAYHTEDELNASLDPQNR